MNREKNFYEKLRREYDEYMEEVRDWDSDKIINNAKYIGDYIRIFEYLIRDEPIKENSGLDFYDRLKNPLKTICEHYQEDKPPIYDFVNSTIWNLPKEELLDASYSEIKYQFLQRIAENYNEPSNNSLPANVRNMQLFVFEYIRCHIDEATDDDINVLMQFKNPFRVIMESKPIDNAKFEKRITETAQYLMNRDIMTLPYELDQFYLMPETKYRHNAINNVNNMVLFPDFAITMNWLQLCRDVSAEDETVTNPYVELMDAFYTVSEEQGNNTLQQIYYMGKENCILASEVIEAGKYLADGGNIEKVPKLAEYGYFECPYEENEQEPEDFLEKHGELPNNVIMM